MLKEIIVCTQCKGEDCRVEQLYETEKINMEEYAKRHKFPKNNFYQNMYGHTARRFLITCQDCGHQLEYMERIENEPMPSFQADPEDWYKGLL